MLCIALHCVCQHVVEISGPVRSTLGLYRFLKCAKSLRPTEQCMPALPAWTDRGGSPAGPGLWVGRLHAETLLPVDPPCLSPTRLLSGSRHTRAYMIWTR